MSEYHPCVFGDGAGLQVFDAAAGHSLAGLQASRSFSAQIYKDLQGTFCPLTELWHPPLTAHLPMWTGGAAGAGGGGRPATGPSSRPVVQRRRRFYCGATALFESSYNYMQVGQQALAVVDGQRGSRAALQQHHDVLPLRDKCTESTLFSNVVRLGSRRRRWWEGSRAPGRRCSTSRSPPTARCWSPWTRARMQVRPCV